MCGAERCGAGCVKLRTLSHGFVMGSKGKYWYWIVQVLPRGEWSREGFSAEEFGRGDVYT